MFGRQSAKGPEYSTGAGKRGKPGIGNRDTDWVSNQGWNGFRCRNCGHLSHGGSPCQCETPDFARADSRWPAYQQWCEAWAAECLRVLRPGGHMLAFGGTRTYHRLACAIEDAGFEIRDSIDWIYGSGFPKSRNLHGEWKGWGTALKPAHEPIVVARKPLAGTVARNVLGHGTGALNIDGCRVAPTGESRERAGEASQETRYTEHGGTNFAALPGVRGGAAEGRWPPNTLLSQEAAAELDRQSGTGKSVGASRFFPVFYYCAKASKKERPKTPDGKSHPTVKPLKLMCWLVRLVTPPGGVVLDPFCGSGTTIQAALLEGFKAIGIDNDRDSICMTRQRLGEIA